jgi:hypothetical protein
VIDQQETPSGPPPPNIATIAFLGMVAGLVLWLGGACLVLGTGSDQSLEPDLRPRTVATAAVATATSTRLADRTSCGEIRGTDYRSQAERAWFLANCT